MIAFKPPPCKFISEADTLKTRTHTRTHTHAHALFLPLLRVSCHVRGPPITCPFSIFQRSRFFVSVCVFCISSILAFFYHPGNLLFIHPLFSQSSARKWAPLIFKEDVLKLGAIQIIRDTFLAIFLPPPPVTILLI